MYLYIHLLKDTLAVSTREIFNWCSSEYVCCKAHSGYLFLCRKNSALHTLKMEDSVGGAVIARFIQGFWIQPLLVLGSWLYLEHCGTVKIYLRWQLARLSFLWDSGRLRFKSWVCYLLLEKHWWEVRGRLSFSELQFPTPGNWNLIRCTRNVFCKFLTLLILPFTANKEGASAQMAFICEWDQRECPLSPGHWHILSHLMCTLCSRQSKATFLWLWSHRHLRWNPSLAT